MIPFIKFKFEHIIILVLAVILILDSCNGENPEASFSAEKTTIEKEIITTRDSSSNSGIKNQIPEEIKIIEREDKVERVKDSNKIFIEDQDKLKTAYRYQDTTHFPGSRVVSEIISEGRILENNLVVEVDHLQTMVTTEKTIVREISGFFFSPAMSYAPRAGIESVEANITYINKGDFGISAGGYYNTITNQSGIKISIHKKIW